MTNRNKLIIACFASVIAISSCAFHDDDILSVIPSGNSIINASLDISSSSSTKTSLNNEGHVLWSEDDAFSLLTSSSNDRFGILNGAGQETASFSGSISGFAPYYAFYPYSDSYLIENGVVRFSLPQKQIVDDGSFTSGSSPAIATLTSTADNAQFKNLCGILQLNLCGSGGLKVKDLEIVNLDGKPLWGDCTLSLDGKQGTDQQTMTVNGGNNVIKVSFPQAFILKASTPRVINVVVPAGSFAEGFSVKVFDDKGDALCFLTANTDKVQIARSFITSMSNLKVPENGEPKDVKRRGYYKDIFMDSGCSLTHRTSLPVATYLGWTMDYMSTSDSVYQSTIIIQSDKDANGALLYPDGEPRYVVMYVNGGKANGHGTSLSATGRNRVVTYNNKGGCYVGSCAGAFLAHPATSKYNWLGLIPAYMSESALMDSTTGIKIPVDSPLLKYGYDFGGDYYVKDVYFNGGGFLMPKDVPAKGEILATYDFPGWVMHDCGSIWAYKYNDVKGRVVVTGSHPEGITSGEQRDLMAAMMLYAVEGAGLQSVKATMTKGTLLSYTKSTGNSAGIGDRQYHHFKVEIPDGAKNIRFDLSSDSELDLHLSVRRGDFAWRTDADYFLAQAGNDKTIKFATMEPGTWYVSVYCPAQVKTSCTSSSFKQTGDVASLNGVPYSIQVDWD